MGSCLPPLQLTAEKTLYYGQFVNGKISACIAYYACSPFQFGKASACIGCYLFQVRINTIGSTGIDREEA